MGGYQIILKTQLKPDLFFHIHTMYLDIIKVFYSQTDAEVVLKTILKFTLQLTLKQLRHVLVQSHHHQGHYSCLLKLQLLK